ncbi:hypothetical protein KPH14_013123, partial [Odynerus spinipes]
ERAVNLKSDPNLVAQNLSRFFKDLDTMAKNMFLVILMNVQPDQVNQAFDRIHSGIDTVKHEILSILQNFRGKSYGASSTNEKLDATYERSSVVSASNVNTAIAGTTSKERSRRKRESEISSEDGGMKETSSQNRSAKIRRTMKRLNVPGEYRSNGELEDANDNNNLEERENLMESRA